MEAVSTTRALPRGPHRLSRQEVQASQLARLLVAILDLVTEQGFAATTITAIARRAGVAPNVFYEHFADREECFLAAYDQFVQALFQRLEAVRPSATEWDDFVHGLLSAYLGLLDEQPNAARAFLVEIDSAGPRARARRREVYQQAAVLLHRRHKALRRQNPALGALPERVFLGFVLAVRDLACDLIENEPSTPLRSLIPDVARWITASVHGA